MNSLSLHRIRISRGLEVKSWLCLRALCLLSLCFTMAACRNIDLESAFVGNQEIYDQIVDQDEDAFAQIDPLLLSNEIKALIDSAIDPRDGEETRVEKLQEVLYGEDQLAITYSDVKTHTAIEAFNAREGNCLSVMNLYVAMARYANVDAQFQTVDVQPNWDRRGDLLVLSQHINATGKFNVQRRYVVDFTPEIALQQLTSSVVTDLQARALYFNNLGVEELIAGNDDESLVYFKNSLFLDAEQSITWNNIGTTYNRLGNPEFAEYSYQKAFELDGRNATAVNNLVKFYRRMGKSSLAREYEIAIERFNNRNPYYHFALGNVAYSQNDLRAARIAFRKALSLKKEEPDFYSALAKVYLDMGDMEQAIKFADSAEKLIALNAEIYVPSEQKVRIIDSSSILRDSSPGLSIIFEK